MAKEQLAEAEPRQDSGDAGEKEMSLKIKALFPVSAKGIRPLLGQLVQGPGFPSGCPQRVGDEVGQVCKNALLNLLFAGNLDKGLAMAFVSSMLAHSNLLKPKSTHRLRPAGSLTDHLPRAVAAVSSPAWLQCQSASSTRKMLWLQFSNRLVNVSIPSCAKICDDSSDPGGWWAWEGERSNVRKAPVLWKSICLWSIVSVLGAEPDVRKLSSKGKPLLQLWC